jgi:RimJ/RimL family protein N-acetyltransferase
MAGFDGIRLETERLVLRPPRVEDFDAWAAFAADEEVARYIGGVQARSVAWRGFLSIVGGWHVQGFSMFSVIEKDSGRWVGRVGPWCPEGWPGTEVGWSLARECWGRGYATEAACAAMDWAMDTLGWTDIIQTIDPRNDGSKAVARRIGASYRGPGRLPAPYEDIAVEIWGQTRDEWRRRRAG